jgi:predicted Zn-dependent peptidase
MSVEITRLANGVHVLSHGMPHLETTALGVWVRAGSRDETAAENGVAHFLEHMAFKGTSRRSARDIAEEIEAAGGDINAATATETTAYHARVLKSDWRLAFDILADILIDPAFDAEELERERDVILQEIAAANDTPDDLVFELLQAQAFPDHPVGRPILGAADLVAGHSAQALRAYRDGHYSAERLVVSAAGAIDHGALVREAERLLADLRPAAARGSTAPSFTPGQALAERPLDQAHVALAFPGVSYHDAELYTLQVLSCALGGGMSSRLFQEAREERGLCYAIFAHAAAFADCGLVSVYAATTPDKTGELIAVTADVIASMADRVEEAEVVRARAQIKASLVMSLESAAGRADQIARQFLALGRVPDVPELIARVDEVTANDVRDLAGRLFRGQKLVVSAVGALAGLPPYERVAARFS